MYIRKRKFCLNTRIGLHSRNAILRALEIKQSKLNKNHSDTYLNMLFKYNCSVLPQLLMLQVFSKNIADSLQTTANKHLLSLVSELEENLLATVDGGGDKGEGRVTPSTTSFAPGSHTAAFMFKYSFWCWSLKWPVGCAVTRRPIRVGSCHALSRWCGRSKRPDWFAAPPLSRRPHNDKCRSLSKNHLSAGVVSLPDEIRAWKSRSGTAAEQYNEAFEPLQIIIDTIEVSLCSGPNASVVTEQSRNFRIVRSTSWLGLSKRSKTPVMRCGTASHHIRKPECAALFSAWVRRFEK